MKWILPLLLLTFSSRAVDVQLWTSFEAGSAGDLLTPTLLEASTIKTTGLGYWTNRGSDQFTVRGTNMALPGNVIIENVLRSDDGSRCVQYRADQFSRYSEFQFVSTSIGSVSAGAWINFNASSAFTFGTFDLFVLSGDGGEFLSANLDDKPGAQYAITCHTHAGGATKIGLATNGTYWVSLLWTNGGNGQISVYDSNLSLVGSTNIDLNDVNCYRINIGRYDAHAVTNDSRFVYDNLLVSTTGSWPLLPSTSGNPTASLQSPTVNAGSIVLK